MVHDNKKESKISDTPNNNIQRRGFIKDIRTIVVVGLISILSIGLLGNIFRISNVFMYSLYIGIIIRVILDLIRLNRKVKK